ncbi:MAG: radical SAM protein [Tissierellia bacterium]|nr:radical SAM protein [Tissierellia bacterium]
MKHWITGTKDPFIFEKKNRIKGEFQDHYGLYIHIPFCKSICEFCPYQKILYSKERMESFLKSLHKEIDLLCEDKEKERVSSLYFGGGSPALLEENLKPLIEKIYQYFTIEGLIGMEVTPEDVIKPYFKRYLEYINGISIGIQTFSEKGAKILKRKVPNQKVIKAELKGLDLKVIDVDLIFGLPEQTWEDLHRDLEMALDMGATQISVYPFIDFTFAKNSFRPLGPGSKRKMLRKLVEKTEELGLERTAVWTFSLPGKDRYSSVTRDEVLGFGPSAVTLTRNQFSVTDFRLENYKKSLEENTLPQALVCDFVEKQRMAYYLFWKGYLGKMTKKEFLNYFGTSLEESYGSKIKWAKRLGFFQEDQETYTMTEKGFMLYHEAEQKYTMEYIDKLWGLLKKGELPERLELK